VDTTQSAEPNDEDTPVFAKRPSPVNEPIPASRKLKAWLLATYPDELHVQRNDIGYYAAPNYDLPTTEEYERYHNHAKLLYYAGWGHGRTLDEKLQAVSHRLDLLGVSYEWRENSYGIKYLLVDPVKLPDLTEPE
jgi:hypothetical protein